MRYVLLVVVIIVSHDLPMQARFSLTLCVCSIQISLHYILSFSHEGYGKATSMSNIAEQLKFGSSNEPFKNTVPDEYYHPEKPVDPLQRRANATFVVLARNSDIAGVMQSMKQAEDRFNKEFRYPWVFLNEEPFNEEFIKYYHFSFSSIRGIF